AGGSAVKSHAIDCDRLGNVLDLVLTHWLKSEGELLADFLGDLARDADLTWFCQLLQSGCDIHPLAVAVAILDDHLAKINSDPDVDALIFRYSHIAFCHASLDRYCAFDRIHHARELGEYAVTHELEDAAMMLLDLRLEDL